MPAQPHSPTLAEVVRRAAQVCDPAVEHPEIERVVVWFEDRDEPIAGVGDVEAELFEATTAVDPEGDDPALTMTRAVATYLAFRRDEVADEPPDILRLAARAEFDGHPPDPVADWLAAQGVEPA